MSPSQWLLLVVLSVLWGGSFLFVGIAVGELPPLTIVLVRVALAALLLVPFVLAMGHRLPLSPAACQPFLVMALLNNVIPFSLITTGQREVASGLASVLNATTPLFTLIIAHALTADEKLAANKLAGVLVGIAGIVLLLGPEAVLGRASTLLGMSLCVGACISYGFAAWWGRRLRTVPPLLSACCQLLGSTAVLALVAGAVDRPWTLPLPSPLTMSALAGLAALSTSLAYVIFFRILAVSGPTNVMLVTLLIPISGIGFGILVLGEAFHPRHALGAIVIASGLLLIDGRILPAAWRPAPSRR